MKEVRGKCMTVSTSFTRPNDTTAYTIGDVINNSTSAGLVLTFTLQAPQGTVGTINGALLQTATIISSVAQSTKLEGRLWLFDTAPAAQNDNSPFTPSDTEMLQLLQVIEFPAASWVAPGASPANAACNAQSLWLPITTTKDANAIYGVLEARNAYTPAAQEVIQIKLGIVL